MGGFTVTSGQIHEKPANDYLAIYMTAEITRVMTQIHTKEARTFETPYIDASLSKAHVKAATDYIAPYVQGLSIVPYRNEATQYVQPYMDARSELVSALCPPPPAVLELRDFMVLYGLGQPSTDPYIVVPQGTVFQYTEDVLWRYYEPISDLRIDVEFQNTEAFIVFSL